MWGFFQFCWRATQNNTVAFVSGIVLTVAGVSYQDWLKPLAANPPPILNNHLVQLSIIAIGVLLLAYVFYHQSDYERTTASKPDMDVRDVFRYLRERSKWSIGKRHEREVDGENLLIDEEIDGMLRSAAAQGRVQIWGKEDTRSWLGNQTEILIESSFWIENRFDLAACVSAGSPDARSWATHRDGAVFKELRSNKAQIFREWPEASYLRRRLDRSLSDRTY